jgi:hypothetical protein
MKGSIVDRLSLRLIPAKWRYGTDNRRDEAGEPFISLFFFKQIVPHPFQGQHNLIPT